MRKVSDISVLRVKRLLPQLTSVDLEFVIVECASLIRHRSMEEAIKMMQAIKKVDYNSFESAGNVDLRTSVGTSTSVSYDVSLGKLLNKN